jgi:glucosamine-6-phosphate deaminase
MTYTAFMRDTPERIPVVIAESYDKLALRVAQRIAALIRERHKVGLPTVLGLATGSTPIGIYRELIRMHRNEALDWSRVVTFNLDEYYPMAPDSFHSYHRFMWENLLGQVNIDRKNVHIPRGDLPRDQVDAHCAEYESLIREAGGIDFQILGIGQTGHIGFNEPGSSAASRTRLVTLDTITRRVAASDFFGTENVPVEALTMGVATILEAREIALLATGEHKAAIVKRSVEETSTGRSPPRISRGIRPRPSSSILRPRPSSRGSRPRGSWGRSPGPKRSRSRPSCGSRARPASRS